MTSLPRIGVDLMGSDTSPDVLLDPILAFSHEFKDAVQLTVLADQNYSKKIDAPYVTVVCCDDVITMEDDPLVAVRRKKNSSLCRGMHMLKNRELDAFITGGNTGALLACAKLFFPMLEGIDRPALMTLLPTQKKPLAVLDVGANVQCKAEHLIQFAQMGIAYQKSRGIREPRVALLNNGTEETKGTPELREAFQQLKKYKYFIGNIEARDVFLGDIDVLVTEGFTGNIFLKTVEGVGSYLLRLLDTAAPPLRAHLNYAEYPGALLSGIDGIALKCHGNVSPEGVTQTLKTALSLISHNFLPLLQNRQGFL
jgi:phosphate acyltransferase